MAQTPAARTISEALDALAQDMAAVLKRMGGSAHQDVVVDCVAALKRQRGESVTADLRQKVIEVCNDGDVVCDTSRTMPAPHLFALNALAWSTTLVERAYDVHGHYGTDDPSANGITAAVLAGYGSDAAAMVSEPVPANRLNRATLEADLAVRREYLALRERGQGL